MYIDAESSISGAVVCSSDMVIRGAFTGSLVVRRVFLMPGARFEGSMECVSVIVQGYLCGSVSSQRMLLALPGAILDGTVLCGWLNVLAGAYINASTASHDPRRCWPDPIVRIIRRYEQLRLLLLLRREERRRYHPATCVHSEIEIKDRFQAHRAEVPPLDAAA